MRIQLLLLSAFAPLALLAQPRRVSLEPAVAAVTVFSSGARVERTGSAALQPGRNEVVFNSLSNQLDPQSVQLKADANVTLLSVKATRDFLTERKLEADERSFRDRIATLAERQENDEKLLQVYQKEEEMVIKNQAIGGTAGVKAPELKAALDLQRQRLQEIYEKQLEISRRIRQEQADIARLSAQLGEFGRKKDSVQYVVTALIDTKETRNVAFRLSYSVKDAGWYPTYDVRVTDIGKPLALLMNANVFQRSGESWKDVELWLSTGNPSDNATPSQLQPWMLGFYDPYMRQNSQAGDVSGRIIDEQGAPVPFATITSSGTGMTVNSDANGYFRMAGVPQGTYITAAAVGYDSRSISVRTGYYSIPLKMRNGQLDEVVVSGAASRLKSGDFAAPVSADKLAGRVAGVQIGGVETAYQPTNTVYKIDEKYSLETDGKTTTIGIKSIDVPASYDYTAVPKIDPSAFLNARITGWQELDLVSGEASLYFEGSYLGKTYLDLNSAGDTLSLSLGKDNGIRITRKLVKEYSTKKFIGSARTDTRQWEITVRNNKRVPVTINLTDQVPVSTVKEISVEDVKTDGVLDKSTGLVTWQLTVAPAQEAKASFGYSVKYPKDRRVTLE